MIIKKHEKYEFEETTSKVSTTLKRYSARNELSTLSLATVPCLDLLVAFHGETQPSSCGDKNTEADSCGIGRQRRATKAVRSIPSVSLVSPEECIVSFQDSECLVKPLRVPQAKPEVSPDERCTGNACSTLLRQRQTSSDGVRCQVQTAIL